MDTREATQQYRLNQWTQRIYECRNSGQKISDWCADHNITETTYYYWLRRVRLAACEALPVLNAGKNTIVPINIPVPETQFGTPNQSSPAIVITLDDVTLEVHNNASQSLIEDTLRAIQNVR